MKRSTGKYEVTSIGGETIKAFIPLALPPTPDIEWSPRLNLLHERAIAAIGRLDGTALILPDSTLFLYSYVRKEALLSSQIEGTQSSLTDLFAYEAGSDPTTSINDVKEVTNYVAAMEHGLARIRKGFPLSNRLICEVHKILLQNSRGDAKLPGEFRKSQNWIGGSRPGNAHFVPPPHLVVGECMSDLEKFINEVKNPQPTLLKAALAHVQFETIHPFLDGNGRAGRLLITLLLCTEALLQQPVLYLSLYFKEKRAIYYSLLDGVRKNGDWESWLEFFFEGVISTAEDATRTAQSLLLIFDRDRKRIEERGRSALSALQIHHHFLRSPILSAQNLSKSTKITPVTINRALELLVSMKIIAEITGRKRGRLFAYSEYLDTLKRGTTPIKP